MALRDTAGRDCSVGCEEPAEHFLLFASCNEPKDAASAVDERGVASASVRCRTRTEASLKAVRSSISVLARATPVAASCAMSVGMPCLMSAAAASEVYTT